jgi:hypothetical protein
VDPRAGLDDVEKGKFLILPGLELRSLGHPACSQLLYWLKINRGYFLNRPHMREHTHNGNNGFSKTEKFPSPSLDNHKIHKGYFLSTPSIKVHNCMYISSPPNTLTESE